MATSMLVKPPEPLNLEERTHRGENWKRFKWDWSYYEVAAKINKEAGEVRVAHLLNVIGKDAQELYETFTLSDDDRESIDTVLEAFQSQCVPETNVIYERYMFNR